MVRKKLQTNSCVVFDCLQTFVSALPLPAVAIVSEGNSVAGENFTVTCVATVIPDLIESAVVTASWRDGQGTFLQPDATLMSGSNTSVVLQFSPMYTSNAGQYLCTSSVSITELLVQQTSSQPFDITVQSKI